MTCIACSVRNEAMLFSPMPTWHNFASNTAPLNGKEFQV